MKAEKEKRISRRAFLRGVGAGAGVSGAAVVALATDRPAEASAPSGTGRRVAGYRETDHVRRAYALSRF